MHSTLIPVMRYRDAPAAQTLAFISRLSSDKKIHS
jgi:hypothetical protein